MMKLAGLRLGLLGLGLTIASLLVTDARAVIIAAYQPNNVDTPDSAAYVDSFASGLDLTRGSGLGYTSGANTFTSRGFNVASEALAISGNRFITFGFTSTKGYILSSLQLAYSSSASGPQNIKVQVSINGGGYTDIFSDNPVSNTPIEIHTVNLSSFNFGAVTSATFRIVGWNASAATGTFRLNQTSAFHILDYGLIINGSPVPEPASIAMIGLGAVCFIAIGLRQRHRLSRAV